METIVVKGVRTNYLKNLDVNIPLNAFNCFTGVSGCGKSSLVYDTIYAESQRAFFEGMSGDISVNRIMDKPDVDYIENLRPAINLSQNYYNNNPRSTVGSITELTYYLRTLFSLFSSSIYGDRISPNEFSTNVTSGCCPKCNGLGIEYVIDDDKIIVDKNLTLNEGAISYYSGSPWSLNKRILVAICDYFDIDINTKYKDLSQKQIHQLLFRKDPVTIKVRYKNSVGKIKSQTRYENGVFTEIRNQKKSVEAIASSNLVNFLKKQACSACEGKRYSERILSIKYEKNDIADLEAMPIEDLLEVISCWRRKLLKSMYAKQYEQILSQVEKRLQSLCKLKLEYLSLDRTIPTLSGGEIQRVRVANQINCSLSGLIYILDEPCKGLHIRNVDSVIEATNELLLKGNTIIAIEHNPKYVEQADNIFELGPVGGSEGGYLQGTRTGNKKYFFDIKFQEVTKKKKYIKLENVNTNNIVNQSFMFPEQAITCITGVSGAGKSSFVNVLDNSVNHGYPVGCEKIETTLKKAFYVNQQPIGKNARSTIVTYLDIFNDIRVLFSETKMAKEKGIRSSDFSFNVEGGRCECCLGTGYKRIEMSYLPDSYILCPECNGDRFKKEICAIQYKNHSITDILKKPINDIDEVFDDKATIKSKLQCMIDMGLGYLALGDMTSKLSGGESQRVKLAKELGRNSKTKIIYILDEPTSGLHKSDIKKIKEILCRLVKKGNTIVMVEHNIEFIANVADSILDFGLHSGMNGGKACLYDNPKDAFMDESSSLYGLCIE